MDVSINPPYAIQKYNGLPGGIWCEQQDYLQHCRTFDTLITMQ
jgi:hypothetical protein